MQFSRQQQTILGLLLFCILAGVYLLTYRGFPLSQDEYFLFDAAESLVQRGELNRTYEFHKFNAGSFSRTGDPWPLLNQEPLSVILLAPFFWLGHNMQQVGTMHVVWLFNIVVTALTGLSIYIGARLLRYTVPVAWLAGLIFGIGTLAWPYSRHLFREPLMALFTWWCFVLALLIRREWKDRGRFPFGLSGLLFVSFGAAFLTKAISVLLLPGLIMIMLPNLQPLLKRRGVLFGLVGLGAVFIAGLVMLILTRDPGLDYAANFQDRYSLDYWITLIRALQWEFLLESFLGYHISPARSLWLHSPILLLAFMGGWVLLRRGEWRLVAGVFTVVIITSAAYGIAHEESWWGSWGWGPRYMLPMTPMLFLLVLPVLRAINKGWQWAGVSVLVITGIGLQVLGMAVRLSNYYTDLNWAGVLDDWDAQPRWAAYNWTWKWSPLKYHLDRLDFQNLDFGWRFADPVWVVPVGALVITLIGLAVCSWLLARNTLRRFVLIAAVALLPVILIGIVCIGLYAIRDDSRYIGEWVDVKALVDDLNAQVINSDAIVFVDRDQYMPLVMNYLKVPSIVAGLPYAPGEVYGPEGPEIITDVLSEQMGSLTFLTLDWASRHHEETWLLASSSPFEREKLRPVERFLATYQYPMTEITHSQRARAVQFYNVTMPQTDEGEFTDYVFDNVLALAGYNLPMGDVFSAGDIVPVRLAWSPVDEIVDDYNISVQIATFDGFPIVQRDGQPQGTFGKTSQWTMDELYIDNHGLQLPDDLPPGDYAVQVVVYRWQDGQRLVYDNAGVEGNVARIAQITVQ